MGGYLHTISMSLCVAIVWQKRGFLPSIDQLAMPTFLVKYVFAMVPTKK